MSIFSGTGDRRTPADAPLLPLKTLAGAGHRAEAGACRAGKLLLRVRIALALFALHAVVTIPWALENWGTSLLGIAGLAAWLFLAALALPMARGRIGGRGFWFLLGAGLILPRLLAYWLVAGATLAGDPGIYPEIARSLMAGEGLIFRDPLTQVDFRALYPPLYPLFLAALGTSVGLSGEVIWLGNLVFDGASAMLIMLLGARFGSAAAGRAAAWLFAIWPAFALGAPFAQKESLVTLEVLGLAFLFLRLRQGRSPAWWEAALTGILAGALALTQPGLTLLPAIFGLMLIRTAGWRALVLLALKSAPFALLLLAPWWIRNFQLFGSFVPLTSTGGLGLWIGNNPNATGNWMPLPAHYRGLPELEMSALAARDAMHWIAGHPAEFVRLTFFKFFHAFGIEQFTLGRFGLMTPKPDPAVFAALFPILQGSLIALFAGAALLARRVRIAAGGDALVMILCACALQIIFLSLPFEFGERHRFFLMPFLLLLVSLGLASLSARPLRRLRLPALLRPASLL